jgi:hypothetical protein
MGYERKGYFIGDIPQVKMLAKKENILFDAVMSYDVLEHIYNLESYFKHITEILNKGAIIYMETGATPYYKEYYHNTTVYHLQNEYLHSFITRNKKEITQTPFFNLRLDIISECVRFNSLHLNELECIGFAQLTTGMIKKDIEDALKKYTESGELPNTEQFSAFRYNTCNPYTGSWEEHFIDFDYFEKKLTEMGYIVEIRYSFNNNRELSPVVQVMLRIKDKEVMN